MRKGPARGRHRRRREPRPCFGELLHLDGSRHAWLRLAPGGKQPVSRSSTMPPSGCSTRSPAPARPRRPSLRLYHPRAADRPVNRSRRVGLLHPDAGRGRSWGRVRSTLPPPAGPVSCRTARVERICQDVCCSPRLPSGSLSSIAVARQARTGTAAAGRRPAHHPGTPSVWRPRHRPQSGARRGPRRGHFAAPRQRRITYHRHGPP